MARIDPRVVEVLVTRRAVGGELTYWPAAGYLIAAGKVLTAAHVTGPEQGYEVVAVEVRPISEPEFVPARGTWTSQVSDLAVLAFDPSSSARAVAMPRWGRVGGAGRVECRAVGFPKARMTHTAAGVVRQLEPVTGFLAPGTAAKSPPLMDMHVTGTAPLPAEAVESGWHGLSGAAVFVGPWLVGVVSAQPPGFGPGRLSVALIDTVIGDAGFAATVGGQVLVEAADLPVWLNPPYELVDPRLMRSAQVLRPRYGVVEFRDRRELGELTEWCDSLAPVSVALVTAGGGQGKTRLAAELSSERTAAGWVCGFVNDRPVDPTAVNPGGCLIVIDYAETRTAQVKEVLEATRLMGAPLRILLLARHAGDLWANLPYQLDSGSHLLGGVDPRPLTPIVTGLDGRRVELDRAARDLARQLSIDIDGPLVPPVRLSDPDHDNLFLVQLAALTGCRQTIDSRHHLRP